MMKRFTTCLAAAAMSCLMAAPAQAQSTTTNPNPAWEAGGGYQFLHATGDAADTLPSGLAGDFAVYKWGSLGLAGEFGWSHDSAQIQGNSITTNWYHLGGGPRFSFPGHERVRPYAQLLAGASILRGHIDLTGLPQQDVNQTGFMLQPGAGVNIQMGPRWGVFGDVAYRRSFFGDDDATIDIDEGGSNEFKLYFGVRFFGN